MSVRLHLSLEKLLGEGHAVVSNPTGGYGSIRLGQLRVWVDGDKAFIDLNNELAETKLPFELDRKFFEEISYYSVFRVVALRRTGEYAYKGATAVLANDRFGNEDRYSLKVAGTDLKDMQQLYRDVREGRIWPVVDYEAEMVPPPARHLRQLFGEAWAIIRRDVSQRFRGIKA